MKVDIFVFTQNFFFANLQIKKCDKCAKIEEQHNINFFVALYMLSVALERTQLPTIRLLTRLQFGKKKLHCTNQESCWQLPYECLFPVCNTGSNITNKWVIDYLWVTMWCQHIPSMWSWDWQLQFILSTCSISSQDIKELSICNTLLCRGGHRQKRFVFPEQYKGP